MRKTKIGALALSVALASAICVPTTALAANYNGSEQATQDSTGTKAEDDKTIGLDGTETTLTGTIKATTLSVSMPTTVAFNVDPGATAGVADAAAGDTGSGASTTSNKHGQFTSPTNYKVKNLSRVKVYAYISRVTATSAATPGTTVTPDLKNTAPTYTASNRDQMMIGIKSVAEAPADFSTDTDWLTTSTTKYYPFNKDNKGEIDASTDGTTPKESDAMMIYGQVNPAGWTDGDSFQIKPTFTVTSTKPTV